MRVDRSSHWRRMSLKQAHYLHRNSREIDSLIDRAMSWSSLWRRMSLKQTHYENVICSRLTKLIWNSNRTEFDDTDCFDSTDSRAFEAKRERDKLNSLFWLVCFTSLSWFSSNQRKFFIVDSINRVNCAYLMSNKSSSDSNSLAVDSIELSSVVQSFDCVDHQVKQISLYSFRCSSSSLNE